MHSVHHGSDSIKISFPNFSRGARLSDDEIKELEDAIAQIEHWNSLVSFPTFKHEADFIKKDLKINLDGSDIPEMLEEPAVNAAPLPTIEDDNEQCSASAIKEFILVSAKAEVDAQITDFSVIDVKACEPPKEQQFARRVSPDSESSGFEHIVLWKLDPHYTLQKKFSIYVDSPTNISLASRIPSDQVCHPLPPAKKERFPLLDFKKPVKVKQPITPKKENRSPFKVRRKPVPRLSDLPSSPTPAPREPKGGIKKQVITSFPALDSGSIGHHYLLDPEVLESPGELRIHNLTVKKLLGIGGQGRVYLAQGPSEWHEGSKSGTGEQMVFAVKVMIKNRHVQYDDILREQKLLRRLRGNRFLLQLEASFHDKNNFYLITEYHTGGDLEELLRAEGYFSVSAARVYTAELCAAVAFLHKQYILHRDIKPSNILIKSDGHICLSDFGLAIDFLDHALDDNEEGFTVDAEPVIRGCAGTAMYMAPEALRGEYYGFKADWWSVGTTCYNLFEGIHPWPCLDYGWLAELAGVEPVKFGLTSDQYVRSFIRALLRKDPEQRLGDRELFAHSFFNGLRIQDVYNGRLIPSYIPKTLDEGNIRSTLTKNDAIEIGEYYPKDATPMANYIFHGPNLCEYIPSPDEIEPANRSKKLCTPISCSKSLYELLQQSFDANGSATLNGSGGMFAPPPGHLEAISGSTIVGEFGLDGVDCGASTDVETQPREEVVRKDPKFRWSMLSVEDDQFDDPMEVQEMEKAAPAEIKGEDEIEIKIEPVIREEDRQLGQEQTSDLNSMPYVTSIPGTSTNLEGIDHQVNGEQVQLRQDDVQIEQTSKPELQSNHQSELITPVMPPTATFASPPHQKVMHREAKPMVVALNDSIIKFHVHDPLVLLSPTCGQSNRDSSTWETVTPSSLGLDGEGDGDETGVTTFDFDIAQSLDAGSCDGPSKVSNNGSRDDDASYGSPQDDLTSADGSAVDSGASSILGKLDENKALHSLCHELEGDKDLSSDVGENNDIRPSCDTDKVTETANKTELSVGDQITVSTRTQTDIEHRSGATHDILDSFEGFVGTVVALVKKAVRALGRRVKILFSGVCTRKALKA